MLPFDALLVDFIVNFIFPLLVGILLIIFESLIKKLHSGQATIHLNTSIMFLQSYNPV